MLPNVAGASNQPVTTQTSPGASSKEGVLSKMLNALKKLPGVSALKRPSGVTEHVLCFDDLINAHIKKLEDHYSLVKSQADKSFKASMGAGFIGCLLIIIGVIGLPICLKIGWIDTPNALTITFIATGAGIITELISGIFFYLYNKTVLQLKEYYDSLLVVQNILLSFRIINDIQDKKEKIDMINRMLSIIEVRS